MRILLSQAYYQIQKFKKLLAHQPRNGKTLPVFSLMQAKAPVPDRNALRNASVEHSSVDELLEWTLRVLPRFPASSMSEKSSEDTASMPAHATVLTREAD